MCSRSVTEKWELVIVDDGSTDGTFETLDSYTSDPRIHALRQVHGGVSAARNRALAATTGEILAYLDSDNTWYPDYLSTAIALLEAHPDRECVYLSQLVQDTRTDFMWVRDEEFDRERLLERNWIDLNIFMHRRSALKRHGGFDEQLSRFSDWDLILRFTEETPPLSSRKIGGWYEGGRPDSISARELFWLHDYRIRAKPRAASGHPPACPLRALALPAPHRNVCRL